jgi:hypothetical protein
MPSLKRFFLFVLLTIIIQINALAAESSSNLIVLQSKNFEHIEFSRIKPNHHLFLNQQLQINVDESASFLMQPFDHVKSVKQISFEWRSDGLPNIKNASNEEQKPGDDAVFKLGLLLKTDGSSLNPFIPKWMKRVEALLNFPSEEMIYLVANAKHAIGEKWANPYNKRVTMISIGSLDNKQGWKLARYEFDVPINVVATWLMADGDNTHSHFTVHIKNINIE